MKILTQIIIALLAIGFASCDTSENSPPYGPTQLYTHLIISDKNGNNLISGNVTVDEHYNLTSPYTLTGTYNDITKKAEIYAYLNKEEAFLSIYSDLLDFKYISKGSHTGTVIYKLQLPSVFGDDRETIIEVDWRVDKITNWSQGADIEIIRINGSEVEYTESKPVVMVIEN